MKEKLQISEPPKNSSDPKKYQATNNQQTGVGAILSHRKFTQSRLKRSSQAGDKAKEVIVE